ncbi:MAG: FKBP-type peptidyl-prolyl cis-trans isomerase N-terminal domain-containing protein [Akkermansiaceae bacterium]
MINTKRISQLGLICTATLLISSTLNAQDKKVIEAVKPSVTPLKVEKESVKKASHGLGYLKGKELAAELVKGGFVLTDFDVDSFQQGFAEALANKESTIKTDEFKIAVDLLKANLQQRELNLAKANSAVATKWLSENKAKKGIQTTKSGLQYEILTAGKGEVFKPAEEGVIDHRRFIISYEAMTLDGTTYERVAKDRLVAVGEEVMPGLREALLSMPVGSTWKLYLKPELAYGKQRINALVGPNQAVIITVTLQGIRDIRQEK